MTVIFFIKNLCQNFMMKLPIDFPEDPNFLSTTILSARAFGLSITINPFSLCQLTAILYTSSGLGRDLSDFTIAGGNVRSGISGICAPFPALMTLSTDLDCLAIKASRTALLPSAR